MQTKNLHVNAKKRLQDFFFVQRVFYLFKKYVPSGVFLTNQHLLILDGHGSHVTLETIEQAQDFGLDMITLPSHTSHIL